MPHTYTTYSLGNSYEGRQIPVHLFKAQNELFRVFIGCGQHGNEPESPGGADLLIDDIQLNTGGFYDNVSIAVVPRINPDGFANETYNNAQGWPIGLDSLYRGTYEARILWKFVNQFKPSVYIDGHNLDAWNRGLSNYLYDRHLQYIPDIVFHNDETYNSRRRLHWKQFDELISFLNANYPPTKFDRFWQFDDDGTAHYYDWQETGLLHHFAAQRFESISILFEGISPFETDPDDNREERAIQGAFNFFKGMIRWFKNVHPELVTSEFCPCIQGTTLPVRCQSQYELEQFDTRNAYNDQTGAVTRLISTRYNSYRYEPTEYVTIPLGYAYPNTDDYATVSWWLFNDEGYGYTGYTGTASTSFQIETIHINSVGTPVNEETDNILYSECPINVSTTLVPSTMTNFSNYVMVFTDQLGGQFLPQLLEPKSQFALTRFPTAGRLLVNPNSDYVVKRLIRRLVW